MTNTNEMNLNMVDGNIETKNEDVAKEQPIAIDPELAAYLKQPNTQAIIKDCGYDENKLKSFDLEKVKVLTSYMVSKTITKKIYSPADIDGFDTQKINYVVQDKIVNLVKNKTFDKAKLLNCEIEKMELLSSEIAQDGLKNKLYIAAKVLETPFNTLQVLISDKVSTVLKEKIYTSDELIPHAPDKIEALTADETLVTIKKSSGMINAIRDKANNALEKGKNWLGKDVTNEITKEFKDGFYSKEQLLKSDTAKIYALTSDVSQAIILNGYFSVDEMLAFNADQLKSFINKANRYNDPEAAVNDLGKLYFYALSSRLEEPKTLIIKPDEKNIKYYDVKGCNSFAFRSLVEKDAALANNHPEVESVLSATVSSKCETNAHTLLQFDAHFNKGDFIGDDAKELVNAIPYTLSRNEQSQAFIKFNETSQVKGCNLTYEKWCLVEITQEPHHTEL